MIYKWFALRFYEGLFCAFCQVLPLLYNNFSQVLPLLYSIILGFSYIFYFNNSMPDCVLRL